MGPSIGTNHQIRSPKGVNAEMAWLVPSGFAWGGEIIQADCLNLPAELFGEELAVVAGQARAIKLYDLDGELLCSA